MIIEIQSNNTKRDNKLVGVNLKKEIIIKPRTRFIIKEKSDNTRQLKRMINIARCNIKPVLSETIFRYSLLSQARIYKILNESTTQIKQTYVYNYYLDSSKNTYQEKINYSCSSGNCLRCKQHRVKLYIKNRIITDSNFKHLYFP